MNMPQRPIPVAASDDDETEGHGRSWADAERAEGDSDETEGHGRSWADAERAEGDSDETEGHAGKFRI